MLSIKTLTHLLHVMAMLCNATYTGLMASKARLTTARWSLTAALHMWQTHCCCLPCPQAWASAMLQCANGWR